MPREAVPALAQQLLVVVVVVVVVEAAVPAFEKEPKFYHNSATAV